MRDGSRTEIGCRRRLAGSLASTCIVIIVTRPFCIGLGSSLVGIGIAHCYLWGSTLATGASGPFGSGYQLSSWLVAPSHCCSSYCSERYKIVFGSDLRPSLSGRCCLYSTARFACIGLCSSSSELVRWRSSYLLR